jgi:hypothetical protein
MRLLSSVIGILVWLIAQPVHAKVYKCTVNGKLTFSDIPCAQGSKQEVIQLQGQQTANKTNDFHKKLLHKPLETQPPKSAIDACFEHYKNRLLDPRAAYVVSSTWSLVTQPNGKTYNELMVDARARNKLGGFIPVAMYCAVTPEGEQIESIMKMYDIYFDLDMTPQ